MIVLILMSIDRWLFVSICLTHVIVGCHFFSSTSIHPSIHPNPMATLIFNMNVTPQQVLGHITAIETAVRNGLLSGNTKVVMKEQKAALVRVQQALRLAMALMFCRENCLPGKRFTLKMFRKSSGPILSYGHLSWLGRSQIGQEIKHSWKHNGGQ